MAARPQRHALREQRRTVLLAGEGLAEQVFLGHLKSLYVARGTKAVTVKNAKGKGGGHVLDYTLRQAKQADFDQVGALLDTDADWGAPQRALARRKGVTVFESTPCLEAVLLRIAGHPVPPGDSAASKRGFAARFGAEAHVAKVYEQAFGREVLDAACAHVPELKALVDFLQG